MVEMNEALIGKSAEDMVRQGRLAERARILKLVDEEKTRWQTSLVEPHGAWREACSTLDKLKARIKEWVSP